MPYGLTDGINSSTMEYGWASCPQRMEYGCENMRQSFEEEYQKQIREEEILPPRWISKYRVCGYIKDGEHKKTYLLESRTDGIKYLMKVTDGQESVYLREEETVWRLLAKQGETAVRKMELLEWEGKTLLLRDYVSGRPLSGLADAQVMPESEVIRYGILLCEELKKLHGKKPPVIHRDIKPENIIRRPDGTLTLIDYETARCYKEGLDEDTYFMGTRGTAAPEQYGFGQSDIRTDIYGIGRTLLYLLTGGYRLEELDKKWLLNSEQKSGRERQVRGRLCDIIRKCCSFDPKDRYACVEQLQAALLKCETLGERASVWESAGRWGMVISVPILIALLVVVILQQRRIMALQGQTQQSPASRQGTVQTSGQSRDYAQVMEAGQVPVLIMGFDMTEYNPLIYDIAEKCENRDYDGVAESCSTLLQMLYQDDFLSQVEPVDLSGVEWDDPSLEEYNIVRLGYERVADKLAYGQEMLKENMYSLEDCKTYIWVLTRGSLESTVLEPDGSVRYSLLHQFYLNGDLDQLDCVLDDLLGLIIEAIKQAEEQRGNAAFFI